jgi:hypothetical protein
VITGCDAQHLIGLVQEDGRCLIAAARIVAMAGESLEYQVV